MQPFLSKLYSIFKDFISVSHIKKILLKLKSYWMVADVPGKLFIMVFFAPSLFVLFWLLIEIAYFVVFTLPGIVIKIVALILLFCVFWSGAIYLYEKLRNVMSKETIDAEHTGGTQNTENGETEKGNESAEKDRKIKWREKV
jgi:UPF0716 family protein affecting phage T7 exclusion